MLTSSFHSLRESQSYSHYRKGERLYSITVSLSLTILGDVAENNWRRVETDTRVYLGREFARCSNGKLFAGLARAVW